MEELQSVVDLTKEMDDCDEIDVFHQTRRLGHDKSLPQIMEQLTTIRQTILDMHASYASEKCQIQ